MRKLLLGALVGLLAVTACTNAQPKPEPTPTVRAAPDPCDLVSATTVANLVGPALPTHWTGSVDDPSSGTCTWRLDVDLTATDLTRRPATRQLQLRTSTRCPDTSRRLDVAKGTLAFCRDDVRAELTYDAVDRVGGQSRPADASQVELMLTLAARDVEQRWPTARPLAPKKSWTAEPKPPSVPDVCTLAGISDKARTDEIGPGRKWCVWPPALNITVTAHADRGGRTGTEIAAVSVRQFAYAWGDGPIVADGDQSLMRSAVGAYQVDVVATGSWRAKIAEVMADVLAGLR